MGRSFYLNPGQIYYVYESKPSEPIIGWHETFDPPIDSGFGYSLIKDTDEVIDET